MLEIERDGQRHEVRVPKPTADSGRRVTITPSAPRPTAAELRANAFAVAVVRRQDERRHVVTDSGVYGVVRHPFYAADPLIFVGAALWLQSYVAALAAVVPVALMVLRLLLEERFLRSELPGYAAYAARVRYRLIPGVW